MFLYIFLLFITIGIMFLIRQFNNKKDESVIRDYLEIIDSGEMNVVTDYNPVGYYVSGDSVQGFQLEIIRELEKEWGIRINLFLENDLDDNLEGLRTLRYDVIARNIPVNSHLREMITFTDPLTYNKLVLVQRKTEFNDGIEPVRQHLELAKQTIYVSSDSPAIMRINNLSHEIGDTIYVVEDPVYEAEQLVMMVASGDIDMTASDEVMAMRLSKVLPEIDIETDISFTQMESWALRKNSPVLLDSLNSWFKSFKNTDEFNNIYRKYYN